MHFSHCTGSFATWPMEAWNLDASGWVQIAYQSGLYGYAYIYYTCMALDLWSHLFSLSTLELVSFGISNLNGCNASVICSANAGIAFSADLILRWVADGFWDFFQGVDAGSLSSTRHVQPLEAGILENLQSIIRVGM